MVGGGEENREGKGRKYLKKEKKKEEKKNGKGIEGNIWRRKIYYLQRRKREGGLVIGLNRNSFLSPFPPMGCPPLSQES